MIDAVPRRTGGGHRRPLGAAALLVALAATSLIGTRPATGAPERLAATGGCRAVGSAGAPTGGGPHRATVVVDTGSRPVWSACVSFDGSISGIEALDRAEDVITDLDPEYDSYAGIGKAVCKLRGVGTAPPDCLGKSVNSWWLSVNGTISPRGAGAITLKDGDVEGWKYGTGGTPRAATEGTEAAAAPPTTTTKPPTPTTQPPTGTTRPGGSGLTGSTEPDGTPADPGTTAPGQTTTTVKGQATTTAEGATTTTTEADSHTTQLAAADGRGSGGVDSDGGGSESASGASASRTGSGAGGDDGGSSSLPAALGFAAVIAAIGGGALLIRRRNAAGPTPT